MSEIELPSPHVQKLHDAIAAYKTGMATYGLVQRALDAMLAAAILAERERCARVCEELDSRCPQCAAHNDHEWCDVPIGADYAAAIRRG